MATSTRLYMDSCCLIDVAKGLKGEREADVWTVQMLLKAAESGEVEVLTSTLSIVECRHIGDGSNVPEETKRLFRSVLESGDILTLVDPQYFIVQRARDLAWTHNINLSAVDAVHVASALETDCCELLTQESSGKMARAKDKIEALGLKLMSPSKTLRLPEKYRQESLEAQLEQTLNDSK